MTSATPESEASTGARARLDLGARTVPGWYWMRSGASRQPYRPATPTAGAEVSHCYSYERSPTSIKDAALELIAGAREKIFLASFRFVDDDLRDALRKAAERLRGGVYVITSIADRDLRETVDFAPSYEEGESEDWYERTDPAAGGADVAAQEDRKHYRDLISTGIWVRGHPEFHAKFLVVDDRAALVSSANLESAALADAVDRPRRARGFDAVTGESGVVTVRRSDAETLARFFARLWYAECVWDAPPGRGGYQLSRRIPVPVRFSVPVTAPGVPGPIWTGGGDRSILEAVHQICDLAREDLILATFSTKGLEDHPDLLFDPIRRALRRGVRVRLLLRSRNLTATRSTVGLLSEWGVSIHGDDKTHAKCAIADRRHGALFSANFDAEHGIYRGVEVGMRLDGEPALTDAADFFDHCIACAPQRLARGPSAADAARSLVAPRLSAWPLAPHVTVACSDQAWSALRATRGPVLYTMRQSVGEDVVLHADGGTWILAAPRGASDRWRLQRSQRPASAQPDRPPALLDSWLQPGRRASFDDPYRDHRVGLCAATLVRA